MRINARQHIGQFRRTSLKLKHLYCIIAFNDCVVYVVYVAVIIASLFLHSDSGVTHYLHFDTDISIVTFCCH